MEKTTNELLRQSKWFLEEYVGQWKITQEMKDEILKSLKESPDWKWLLGFLCMKSWMKIDIKDRKSIEKMLKKMWLNFGELWWNDYMEFLWKTAKNAKATQKLNKKRLKDEKRKLQEENDSLQSEIWDMKDKKSRLQSEILSLKEARQSEVHELLEKLNQSGMLWDVSVLDSFREQPDWNGFSLKQKIERFSELLFSSWIAKTQPIELGKKVTITIPWEKKITLMFSTKGYEKACPWYDQIMDNDIEKRENDNAKKFWLMCKSEWCEMLSKKTVKKISWILYELFEKLWKNNINLDKDLYTFAIILFQSLWSDPRGIWLSDKNLGEWDDTLYSLLYYPRENWNMYEIIWLCNGDRDQRYLAFVKIW